MLRVYLDQNKWIDLVRANRGQHEALRDVLDLAHEGTKLGIISFPLSSTHYMETWNARSAKRRWGLASIMLELARPGPLIGPHTIAGPPEVVPMELDIALQARFGRPLNVRRYPLFGEGVGHAFGQRPLKYTAPSGLPLTREQRDILEYHLSRHMEVAALAGPPVDFPVPGIDTETYKRFSQRYVDGEEKLAKTFQQMNASQDQRSRYISARAILDILEPLNDALRWAGIHSDEFLSLSADEMTAFLRDVPSRHVDYELHCLRYENPQLKRKRGDLCDLAALSIAVVYCDIVVTERFWASLIKRAGLDSRYDTRVLSNLHDLVSLLVAAP